MYTVEFEELLDVVVVLIEAFNNFALTETQLLELILPYIGVIMFFSITNVKKIAAIRKK